MLRAVIFDIDGTLLDSVDQHAEAWREAFERFGVSIPFSEIRYQIGKGGDKLLETFLDEEQRARIGEKIERFRRELFEKKFLAKCKPFPRVRELLEKLRRMNLKVALASSAKRDQAESYKRILDVEDLVDHITTSSDVGNTKPDPEALETVRAKLGGIQPDDCVFVGDSPYDAEAAKRDGMPAIGVLCGGFPEKVLRNAGVDQVYRDPEDLFNRWLPV